jgi:L-malate glycosyltransferase
VFDNTNHIANFKSINILVSVTDLCIGGGQNFAVRLSKQLAQEHFVVLFNYETFEKCCEPLFLGELPDNLKIVSLPRSIYWLAKAIDAILVKVKIKRIGWETVQQIYLKAIIAFYKIDIVNSHLYNSDYFVVNTLRNSQIPIVITDHGDYRYVVEQNLATPDLVKTIFDRANAIVYPCHSNAQAASKYASNARIMEKVIYYGIPTENHRNYDGSARQQLGITQAAVVFGMVARGIPNKGWAEAIEAFNLARLSSKKEIHLILVGDGDHLSFLARSISSQFATSVHFTGYSSAPSYWIDSFDVGLLPTYFAGESLPNSIIEYLLLGKPVIASDVGGITEMIDYKEQNAGFTINLTPQGKVDINKMAAAMFEYTNNPKLLKQHSDLAQQASEKFRMETCLNAYTDLFTKVISRPTAKIVSETARAI